MLLVGFRELDLGKWGGLTIAPLKITAQEGSEAAKQQQYPITLEWIIGLKPVMQSSGTLYVIL